MCSLNLLLSPCSHLYISLFLVLLCLIPLLEGKQSLKFRGVFNVLNTHFIILFSMDFICLGDNNKRFKALNSHFYV